MVRSLTKRCELLFVIPWSTYLTQTIRALVFDLDGTLIDSRRDIAQAVNYALSTDGREPLPEEVIATFVGDGAATLIARAANLPPESAELRALLNTFRAYYTAHATVHTKLYPTVLETLERLLESPYGVALCTNKPRQTTDRVLANLGLERYFDLTVCADDLPHKKPHPGPLLHIAHQLSTTPDHLVMIGDGPQDVECGRSAGARTVGVTYGIKPLAEVMGANPEVLIDSLDEVLRLFPWS